MAFDFPSSPTTGQTYSVTGGPTYVYNGTAWVVLTPGNQFNRTVFTATAGQTTFTMNYVVGAIDVYRNGVKLAPADFTATNGTSIVLLNAATVGDTIEVISYPMITYSDAVRRTGDTMTGNLTVPMVVTDSPLGYRNRIINGAMEFNQRGAGILTLNSTIQYPADRWTAINVTDGTVTGRITTNAPTGFTKALYFDVSAADTSLAAGQYTNIQQRIEGFNISDFEWGTANAKSITVSFWVRSSLTGTFAGAIRNGDNTRTYLFTFPINSANTYEYKTITIPGDTSGTWATDSSAGMAIGFTLGCGSTFVGTGNTWLSGNYINATGAVNVIGTTGANLYIGGVQLEVGSVATPFERRPYGQELALCQRYCQAVKQGVGVWTQTNLAQINVPYFVPMRATPSVSQTGTITATDYIAADQAQSAISISILNGNDAYGTTVNLGNFSGFTVGRVAGIRNYGATGLILFSAEL